MNDWSLIFRYADGRIGTWPRVAAKTRQSYREASGWVLIHEIPDVIEVFAYKTTYAVFIRGGLDYVVA